MTGFKVTALPAPAQPAPAPRPVIAPDGTPPCGETQPESGARCERPWGHDGGHLSQTRDKYWQAAS